MLGESCLEILLVFKGDLWIELIVWFGEPNLGYSVNGASFEITVFVSYDELDFICLPSLPGELLP